MYYFIKKGRTVFLNCWATWCGPCVAEMPSIDEARKQLDSTKIVFIAIAKESEDVLRSFIQRNDYGLTFGMPVRSFKELGVNAYPTTYIIDKKGHVAFSEIGGADWSDAARLAQIRQIME